MKLIPSCQKSSFIALFLLFITTITGNAQQGKTIEPCGNGGYHIERIIADSAYRNSLDQAELAAKNWLAKNPSALKDNSSDKVVIPVVFHVVYNENEEATEKLNYEKFVEQIEILNRDFNRYNKDRINTRPIFDSIAGSVNLVFALATKDPDGNPSAGVTYTSTTAKGFDLIPSGPNYPSIDSLKSTTGRGKSAWPTDKYFNIWVAHLTYFTSDGLYGIATFPRSMPENEVAGQKPPEQQFEGVAMFYRTIALNTNTSGDTLFAGRTLTHEVGHFLGLRHIWGDSQTQECDSSDYVDDTPQAKKNANFVCNLNTNECPNENPYWAAINPPNMVENYMDYSGDQCYNMFSNGQISRMQSFLNTDRIGLWQASTGGGKDQSEFKAWGYTDPLSGCSSDCDGKLELIAQKGTPPYQYMVDGFPSANMVDNVCDGLHSVVVSDALGATINFDLFVGDGNYQAPKYSRSRTNASCFGCPDGKVKVNIQNGRAPMTIEWQVNPPVTGPQLTGCTNGYYVFIITDGCGKQYKDSIKVDSPSGIAEMNASQFSLYPNPVNNELQISFEETLSLSAINIRNVLGSIVKSYTLRNKTQEITLSVDDLPTGVYSIELLDDKSSQKTLQFVKH